MAEPHPTNLRVLPPVPAGRAFAVEVTTGTTTVKIEADDEAAVARLLSLLVPRPPVEAEPEPAQTLSLSAPTPAAPAPALIETPDYIPQKQAVAIRVNGAERKVPSCVATVAALFAKGERRQRIRPETLRKLAEHLPELRTTRDCAHKILCNRAMFVVEAV